MYGISIAGMLGKRLNDLAEVQIDPESAQKAAAAVKARQPYRDLLFTRRLPDGRTVHVKTSGVPVFGGDGQFCGYCGVAKDVTAQLESERALRESERELREVLEAGADHYFEMDAQYRHVYVSESFATTFGIPTAEWIGKRFTEVPGVSVSPEMAKLGLDAHRAKQRYRDLVWSFKTREGTKWLKSSGAPIFDRKGVFQGYRGMTAEITKHVEAEAAARLARQHLDEAVAHIAEAIAVYDAEDRAIAFNQAFMNLHLHMVPGVNPPSYIGVAFREISEWQLRVGFLCRGRG
jgi:PAS domain S-box-containing protein